MEKKIFIYTCNTKISKDTENCLKEKLAQFGFTAIDTLEKDTELAVCIGGDGTFLEFLHKFDMPNLPVVGINTGHLGFFQEIMPQQLTNFLDKYTRGKYSVQVLNTVKARIITKSGEHVQYGLNEIAVKTGSNYPIHLDLSIGGSDIERFSGDGLLVSTPAGSTAYNYSLGGSIVDPRLKLLQVTPMAPMNTNAYRSFMSSILLPYDLNLGIKPDFRKGHTQVEIQYDGFSNMYEDIEEIVITFSDKNVHLIRLDNYDFWSKVKSKFL